MPADLLVVISWTWLFAGFCVCIGLRISLIYSFMQRTPAQHLDNTVSQLCPVQRQLSVFRQFGRSPECWNCLNMRPCYYNWFITTGFSCHASFMGQRQVTHLPCCRESLDTTTQLRFKSDFQHPNTSMNQLPLALHSCCHIKFHKAYANSSCQCVIIFEKQGRPINTV